VPILAAENAGNLLDNGGRRIYTRLRYETTPGRLLFNNKKLGLVVALW
jgi:hypothetical protein